MIILLLLSLLINIHDVHYFLSYHNHFTARNIFTGQWWCKHWLLVYFNVSFEHTKKFHSSALFVFRMPLHVCPSDAREAFVLWPLTDLAHLCMCESVCVCLSNGASRGHLGYSYIDHLPRSFFPFLTLYTSTVSPSLYPLYSILQTLPSTIIFIAALYYRVSLSQQPFSSFISPSASS